MINKQKIISGTLIILGSFLEVFYYFSRYYSEGTHWTVSVIQGVALTSLLMGLFLLRDRKYIWLLIVPLAMYSIFNTAAGQRQALTMKAEKQVEDINTARIADLEATIRMKQERYKKVDSLISNSISTFDDAWEWKNTTKKYETELDKLTQDIESLRNQISELRTPKIEESETGKLYRFYSNLIGISPNWLQFWLQVVFSFFIAIMAPTGLVIWPKEEDRSGIDWSKWVSRWVHINWIGIRNKSSNRILSKDKFMRFLAERNEVFASRKYDRILNTARKLKIIDGDEIMLSNEQTAIKKLVDNLS